MDPERSYARSGTHSEPVEAAFTTTTPAEVERAIEATSARYVADFAALYDRISAEVGRLYEGQIEAQRETIAELRRRAEAAEATEAAHEPVVAELRHRVVEQDRTLAALTHRAAVAEREAATLRALLATPTMVQDEPEGDRGAPAASGSQRGATGGLRARLARWWRGEAG